MGGTKIILGIAAVVSLARSAAAEEPGSPEPGPGKMEGGLYLGTFISNNMHQFYQEGTQPGAPELDRINPEVGGRFAVFPGKYLGLEGEAGIVIASTKPGDSINLYRLRAQVVIQKPGRFTPFLAAGLSTVYINDDMLGHDWDVPIHIGGGARYFVTSKIALRLDARYLRGPSRDDTTLGAGYGELMLGVSFGASATAAAPVVEVNPDPDGDGVLGAADLCPDAAAKTADGCPVKDSDGDGMLDPSDKCPTEAETVNGYQDDDGCPDLRPDSDGDKIFDDLDKCPQQPEDNDGVDDTDGCPDPDNDGDGVMDGTDVCPNEKGVVENRGCPDKDRDGDGVVDRLDNCPDEAGTAKNFGCKAKQLVTITQTQIKILEKVQFATAKAKIEKRSNKLLDNVAAVMIAHPEIKKVQIEGHTDDVGNDQDNKSLSQTRADAVAQYLVTKGIAIDRLVSIGFGEERPIGDNKTKKGKEQNRRVEFNIVDPAPPAAPKP